MTTNAPNKNNYKKLPKVSPSPKPPDKKYPVIHSEHEVVVHPPIPKKKCPYCNFVNEDGSHRTRGENFMENVGNYSSNIMFISDDGTIHCHIDDSRNRVLVGYSIKIPNCPFCKRKL